MHQAVMFVQLPLERAGTSNGSYLHQSGSKTAIKSASQLVSQSASQSATTENQQAGYTRNKRQRITHTVILSTSHQWAATHNTLCQPQIQRLLDGVTKNGDSSLLKTHRYTHRHTYAHAKTFSVMVKLRAFVQICTTGKRKNPAVYM